MKLASWSDLVKPDRAALAAAAATAAAGLLAVWLVLLMTDQRDEHAAGYGEALARAMAELAVEPMIRGDRMHLGVMGNRLVEAPEVLGVATYDAADRLLASTGTLSRPHFTKPVIVDAEVVGYVRVAVDPAALAAAHPARLPALLAAAVLLPLLVGVGTTLARTLPAGVAARRRREPAGTETRPPPSPAPLSAEEPVSTRRYLLAVNLYNQFSLQPTEREFELSLCAELAETVAAVYQGQVVALPGVGTLVDFDDSSDSGRPFEVVRAAFLLARLLRDEAPFGTYRLGLHRIERSADSALPLDDPAVADAALLSALAKDLTLAASETCMTAITEADRTNRITCRSLVNPLLDELSTSGPRCALITGLSPDDSIDVARELESMRHNRDAAPFPSAN